VFFVDPRDNWPLNPRKKYVCMDWCTFEPWRKTGWTIGSWCLINLLATKGRYHYIFSFNYGLSSFWVSMWTTLTSVSSMRFVLALLRIDQMLGVTHWEGHLLLGVFLTLAPLMNLSLWIILRTLVLPYHVSHIVYRSIVHMWWRLGHQMH
jgi:hypothetical protein